MIRSQSSARQAILIGVVLVVVVAAASFLRPAATATAPQSRSASYPQLVRVWLHGDAVYPPVIRARAGKILLRAENQTQSDVALVLERVLPAAARQRAARVRTASKALRADMVLALAVGEYEFYDEAFPEARGTLIVEP